MEAQGLKRNEMADAFMHLNLHVDAVEAIGMPGAGRLPTPDLHKSLFGGTS